MHFLIMKFYIYEITCNVSNAQAFPVKFIHKLDDFARYACRFHQTDLESDEIYCTIRPSVLQQYGSLTGMFFRIAVNDKNTIALLYFLM